MKRLFIVTRHIGIVSVIKEMLKGTNFETVKVLPFWSDNDTKELKKGETVIGVLPVDIIADICEKGGNYYHLFLNIPQELKWKELTEEQVRNLKPRLEEFSVNRVPQGVV